MTESINTLSTLLLAAGKKLLTVIPQDLRLNEVHGWNFPPLNKKEISKILTDLSEVLLKNANYIDMSQHEPEIKSLILIVGSLDSQIITNMAGNPTAAFPPFFITTQYIHERIAFMCQWQTIKGGKILPPALLRTLQEIQQDIDGMSPDRDALKHQMDLITAATTAAEELPTNLKRLKETNDKITEYLTETTQNNARIFDNTEKSKELMAVLELQASEAKSIILQCEEAYRTTTSSGLAAAFDERAKSLNISIRLWVFLLALSLIAGAWIGYVRVEQLTSALNMPTPDWGIIWAKGILSALSIGAPLWLAWLSTKQIGQRFRLAEDYGFKASVAKAYEGYRREAAKIDDAFVSRLFGSALTRLEEAPLRLVEQATHSSPWDELKSSSEFKEALEKVPALADRVTTLFKSQSPKKGDESGAAAEVKKPSTQVEAPAKV